MSNTQPSTFNEKSRSKPSRGAFNVGISYTRCLDNDDTKDLFRNKNIQNDIDSLFMHPEEYDIQHAYETSDNTYFDCANLENSSTSTIHEQQTSRKKRKITVRRNIQNDPDNCINTSILPDNFKDIFDFRKFNRMQSESFQDLYNSDENCVISSPTGSGKTVLFELAVLRLVKKNNYNTDNLKILYIAPTKSLCFEKLKSWGSKFINLSVGMLTSDTSYSDTDRVRKSNIIITTPEKWDLLTRKWDDYSRLFELVKLILVDEIHTLKERRGSALEVVLTRMNYIYEDTRIVAVSATIPNIDDVAHWLKSSTACGSNPAKVLKFDDSYRQVILEKHVYGYNMSSKNDFQKDAFYNSKLDDIFYTHGKQRPILIFCATRASTVSTAKYIASDCSYSFKSYNNNGKNRFNDNTLQECYRSGVMFHHAGLSLDDRRLVEEEFINGNIKILCSTSTLAVGVNLPAYLVVVKGTRMWSMSESQEYSELDILQMIGRAGRPQFEKEGCGIILTDMVMKERYETLVNGTDDLESSLHLDLLEHITAEISLGTITSLDSAIIWLKNTFFYTRYMKTPFKYQQIRKYCNNSSNSEFQLLEFCQTLLDELKSNSIIEDIEGSLVCTPYGHSMSRHYVQFKTVQSFIQTHMYLTLSEVLNLVSKASEFDDIRMRHNEKRLFKEINSSPLIKFPYLTKTKQSQIIDNKSQKVSLIIQYELGGLEFPSYNGALKLHQTLVQDKLLIFRHCFRVLKSMIDTFIGKKDGISLKNALFLYRCIHGSCWEDTAMVLRQLKNVGLVSVRKFLNQGITRLDEVFNLTDSQIEYYLTLKPPNGSKIRNDALSVPKLKLKIQLEKHSSENDVVTLFFKIEISSEYQSSSWHNQSLTVDVQIFKQTGEFIDFRRIKLSQLKSPKSYRIDTIISSNDETISFSMNCQEIAGIGNFFTFSANEIPKKLFLNKLIKNNYPALERCVTDYKHGNEDSDLFLSSDDSLVSYLNDNKINKTFNSDKHQCYNQATANNHYTYNNNANNLSNFVEQNSTLERVLKSNGNYECHHSCKDKSACRHLCCKEGIPEHYLKIKPSLAVRCQDSSLKKCKTNLLSDDPRVIKVVNNGDNEGNSKYNKGVSGSKDKEYKEGNLLNFGTKHGIESEKIFINEEKGKKMAQYKATTESAVESSQPPLFTSDPILDVEGNGLNFLGSDVEFN